MSGRYLVRAAKGEQSSGAELSIQQVLDETPQGYDLHSITPWVSGSGYVHHFVVVFERESEPSTSPPLASQGPPGKVNKARWK